MTSASASPTDPSSGRSPIPPADIYAGGSAATLILRSRPAPKIRAVTAILDPPAPFTTSSLDALPPVEMARKAEQIGVTKAGMSAANTLALGVLAGAFIAMGAIFATTVTAGGANLPYGVSRLLAGLAFSLGLILVVVAGAELFTGNNLIVMAWASRRVSTARLLRNWSLVYAGNLAGSLATAGLLFA